MFRLPASPQSWIVRVTNLPWAEDFYLVGYSDDDDAIDAVRKRVGHFETRWWKRRLAFTRATPRPACSCQLSPTTSTTANPASRLGVLSEAIHLKMARLRNVR